MNILVVAGEGVGNVIMVTPLIRYLKSKKHRVYLTIKPINYKDIYTLFENHKLIDGFYSPKQVYDNILVTWWGIYHGKGRITKCKKNNPLLRSPYRGHEMSENLAMAFDFGLNPKNFLNYLSPFINHKPIVDHHVNNKIIGIHAGCNPGPKWVGKKWPHYKKLIQELKNKDYKVALFGQGQDEYIPNTDFDYFNKFNLLDTARHMAGCDVFISNDSGTMHMASAIGIKHIGIFVGEGYKLMAKNNPNIYNKNSTVIGNYDISKIKVSKILDLL